jgi:cytidylate kinase
MGVVTVSRWYGAGGRRVAPAMAEALGYQMVDRELVEMAANRLGVDPELARRRDERVPDLMEELGRALAAASPELAYTPLPQQFDDRSLAEAVQHVVRSLAERGGFVILGRGAQAVLAARDDVCNILLVGDEHDRLRRVMRSQGIDEKEARARMERADGERRGYVRRFHGADINDPALYDVIVNTSRLGLERATRVAIGAARIKLQAPG